MSKCRNCLSEEICRYNDGHNLYCKDDYVCPHFKNWLRWIELFCGVGDIVYFIRNNKIIETTVEKIAIKKTGIYLKLSCNAMYETSYKSIGKTVFFTREEAEETLKALEEKI